MSENNNQQPTTMIKKIGLTKNGVKHEMEIRINFEGVSKAQLLTWAFADRIIAAQRVLRECDADALSEFSTNGYKCHALAAGTKPVTLAESMSAMKAMLGALPMDQRAKAIEDLMNEV